MDAGLLIARFLLAAVFAVAGVAKLADRPGSRQALQGFHVPEALVPAGSIVLPLAELAVSLALLLTVSAWWGALGALALLLTFVVGIGISLARGEAPDCHCFGQIHSEPAGWSTILRNAILLFIAGFVAWQGPGQVGPSTTDWVSRLTGGERATLGTGLILLATIAAQGWFVFNLLRQMGRLVVRMESLESTIVSLATHGAELPLEATPATLPIAPAFALSGLYGETVTLGYLLDPGKPLLLLFASSDCGPCTLALTEASRWQVEKSAHFTVVPIIQGTVEAVRDKATQLGLSNVLLQDPDVAEGYGAQTMPSGVLISADGSIGSAVAEGPDAITALFLESINSLTPVTPLLGPTTDSETLPGSAMPLPATQPSLRDLLRTLVPPPSLASLPAGSMPERHDNVHSSELVPDLPSEEPLVAVNHALDQEHAEIEDEQQATQVTAEPINSPEASQESADIVIAAPSETVEQEGALDAHVAPPGVLEETADVGPPEGSEEQYQGDQAPRILSADSLGAPEFALAGLNGETVTLDDLRVPGRPVLLLFASAGCGPCTLALTEASRWQAEHHSQISVVPMIQGSLEAVQVKAQQLGLTDVLIQDSEVAGAYGATMPSGVLVNPDGTLGSEVAPGPDAIRTLFDDTLALLNAEAGPDSSSEPTESLPEPVVSAQSSTEDVVSDLVPEPAAPGLTEITASETYQNGHAEATPHLPADGSGPTQYLAETGADPDSPSADPQLLAPLKLSSEYRKLQDRGSQPSLADSWQEDDLHFFVFLPEEMNGTESAAVAPTAVFVMRPGVDEPVSAVVVIPKDGGEPDIVNLRPPDQVEGLNTIAV
jgi:peroxiredoxin/uncharacterized membrane protein YphA (DoxX/SURF4 family)